jgi:nucleoside-diphosphate-sugar epimerase
MMKDVFITGGTGYMGKRLIRRLLEKGHNITALVRKGSENKLPKGAEAVYANPFDPQSFQGLIPADAVFVQLLGVAHPSPKKAKQFIEVDLRSVRASVEAAAAANVSHFIYVSVNQVPSRIMNAYQQVRKEGESYCRQHKLNCTFLRPWYVLGPGHWWPVLLLPFFAIATLVPGWRKKAANRSLVTIHQMIRSLEKVVEEKPAPLRILEIQQIRDVAVNGG